MRPFRFLPWLITGFLGGAGAAAWLLQRTPKHVRLSVCPLRPPLRKPHQPHG